ncbi:hypothetical protein C0991_000425, partial [Blastosporella zonata]
LDDIISNWQHKFSSTANQFLLSNIFQSSNLSTPEARRMWVEWALARDLSEEELKNAPEHSRHFYYREYEEQEDGEAIPKVQSSWSLTGSSALIS